MERNMRQEDMGAAPVCPRTCRRVFEEEVEEAEEAEEKEEAGKRGARGMQDQWTRSVRYDGLRETGSSVDGGRCHLGEGKCCVMSRTVMGKEAGSDGGGVHALAGTKAWWPLLVAVPGMSRRPWPKATPPLQGDADEGDADDARHPAPRVCMRGARERVRERKATLRVSSG